MKKQSAFILALGVLALVMACAGSPTRSAAGDFPISEVQSDLNTLSSFSDATVTSAVTQMSTMINSQNGWSLYYATAPSPEMGSIAEVFDINFSAFSATPQNFSTL